VYRRSGLRMPRWSYVVMGGVLLLTATVTALMWATQYDQPIACAVATVPLLGIPILILVLRGSVTVDEHRLVLEITPVFRKTIPKSEITDVTLTEVHPMRDFGGYGYRLRGGVIGFVHEAGPAVRVTTTHRKTYVISAPNAADLAATLRPATR
jgi:hypothetical protein